MDGAVQVLAARVLLEPRDLEVSLAFYDDGLGLHRFREWGQRPHRGGVLFLGGAYLELKETRPGAPPARLPVGVRLWLQVPDLAACLKGLAEGGIAPLEPLEHKSWGLIEATVSDPDGLHLVLVEVPADHPLRRDTR